MKPESPIIAEFTDYPGFLAAMRGRAKALQIATSSDNANDIAGLPDQYIAKLLAAKPTKRIGMLSLGPMLGVLGVKLVMIEDKRAMELYVRRLTRRNENLVRAGCLHIALTNRFMRKIQRLGGRARWVGVSKRKRKQFARKAARARWDKARSGVRCAP